MFVSMKGMIVTWIGAASVTVGLLVSTSHAREFTNAEGKKMIAEPVSVAEGKVIFKKADGKKFSYVSSKLSKDDQDFLKKWAKTSMKYDIKVSRAQAVQFDSEGSKNGGTRTKVEFQGYEVFVKNGSRTPVTDIVCCDTLFPKLSDKYAKDRNTLSEVVHGKVTLKAIPSSSEISFKTKPVSLETSNSAVTSGNVRTVMKWRESLDGGNFNFHAGERLIASYNIGGYKSAGAPLPDEVQDDAGKGDNDDDESSSPLSDIVGPSVFLVECCLAVSFLYSGSQRAWGGEIQRPTLKHMSDHCSSLNVTNAIRRRKGPRSKVACVWIIVTDGRLAGTQGPR